MLLTIIGLAAAAVCGVRPGPSAATGTAVTGTATTGTARPEPGEYAPDAYRRRQERFRAPTWLDQRNALRNVNGVGGRWI
jgi:hypothetical protein